MKDLSNFARDRFSAEAASDGLRFLDRGDVLNGGRTQSESLVL